MRAEIKEISINLNDKIVFSPTMYGEEAIKNIDNTKYRITKDGMVEMQLWVFIKVFGGKFSLTNPCPAEHMELIIRCE